jgi:hypothetical protein
VKARALRRAVEHGGQGAVAQPAADDGLDAARGRHLGGDDLRAHPARAQRRRRVADREVAERREVRHRRDELGVGVQPRAGREQAVDVGQQHEQVGADEHRHLGGQEVVVAEGDLVGRRRVVLVDDRQHAPVEQLVQRAARVEVVRARAHVEERQQHLGRRDAVRAQQLVVDAVELALADRAGRLEVLDRPGAGRQSHDAHAARDRAARDEHDVVAGGVARRGLRADALDDGGAQLAVVLGDDARTELDDVAGHARSELTRA